MTQPSYTNCNKCILFEDCGSNSKNNERKYCLNFRSIGSYIEGILFKQLGKLEDDKEEHLKNLLLDWILKYEDLLF